MSIIEFLQWPAMAITGLAAWFMGSVRARRRVIAFWCFTIGNALWVIWGANHEAYGLITLEIILALMNMRGLKRNLAESRSHPDL